MLSDLTDPQRQAVLHTDGPLLIIAGAGSGKTRVITRRIAYLLDQGVAPSSILAITFTNKAAGEMKTRVSSLISRPLRDFGKLDQPWPLVCTFHSLGLRICRHYSSVIDLPPNFSIYDTSDQEKAVKQAIESAELRGPVTPSTVLHAISNAKNKLLTPEKFAKLVSNFDPHRMNVNILYKHYQKILKSNNALDFDDLLMVPAMAFEQHPEILDDLHSRFSHILIDEYQDTNHVQYVLARELAKKSRNICVVGDPDQSIYAWRGADIGNILDFERDYPDATVVKLEQNYRSTQNILDIASKLIAKNSRRKDKKLFTDRGAGEKAIVLVCPDERAEAAAIAERFSKLHEKEGFNWSDMAVFYRVNALSRVVEDAFRRAQIPYRIAKGVDFYHRKEIKDVLAYLKVLANPNDQISLGRIINVPARGISNQTQQQLLNWALDKNWTLWQTMQYVAEIPDLRPAAVKAVQQFATQLKRWISTSETQRLPLLINQVVRESGLEAFYAKENDPESDNSPIKNVEELVSSAAEYDQSNPEGNLTDYLAGVSLVSDLDCLPETGAVALMTLHSAKGLEFPVVAMVGLEEMILPHARVEEKPNEVEEERRLCFVGITRAQEHLILSNARWRTTRGVRQPTRMSRFISEMPQALLQVEDSESGVFSTPLQNEPIGNDCPFTIGQKVKHKIFGIGTLREISKIGGLTRLSVVFPAYGAKTLILEFAKLEPA